MGIKGYAYIYVAVTIGHYTIACVSVQQIFAFHKENFFCKCPRCMEFKLRNLITIIISSGCYGDENDHTYVNGIHKLFIYFVLIMMSGNTFPKH